MNSHPQQRNKRLSRRRRYDSKGNKSNKSSKNSGSKSSKSGAYNNQYTKSGKGSTTKASKSKSSKANIFTHNNIGGSKSSSKSAKAHTTNLFTSETNFDVHVISPHIPPPFIQTNQPTTKPIVYMHSCTGEPCPLDTQCRSPGGMCGTNCNALSIWNSSCPKITQEEKVLNTPTPTIQPTTPYINELECTGLPCTGENREVSMAIAFLMKSSGIPLCRAQNGACGSGVLYCNEKSIWNEDCPSNSPTLKPTVETTLAPVSEQPVSYSAPPTSSQPTIMQQTNEPTVTLIPTCLLVQTDMSDSGGYINVYVNDGSGSGYIEVTTPNIIYSESQVVIDECYNGLVGVQIRNPTPTPWMGGITTSINNKLDYFPMNCDDCTIGLNFTELLDYTPPSSSGEIMITTEKIVVDGNDVNEQGGGVALCLNGLDENGGNSCTLRNMATFQPTFSPTDTVSPTPQDDSSAAQDTTLEIEITVPSSSSSDEVEEISPDDFESNKEIVNPSSSGTASDSGSGGFPIGGYIGIGVAVVALLAMLVVVKKMRTRRQKRFVEEVSQEEENDNDELIDQQNDESFESRPYSPSESDDSDSD